MCQQCDSLKDLFARAKKDPHASLRTVHQALVEQVHQGNLSVCQTDCRLEDLFDVLAEEKRFVLHFALCCTHCGTYFRLGICVRGEPSYRVEDH